MQVSERQSQQITQLSSRIVQLEGRLMMNESVSARLESQSSSDGQRQQQAKAESDFRLREIEKAMADVQRRSEAELKDYSSQVHHLVDLKSSSITDSLERKLGELTAQLRTADLERTAEAKRLQSEAQEWVQQTIARTTERMAPAERVAALEQAMRQERELRIGWQGETKSEISALWRATKDAAAHEQEALRSQNDAVFAEIAKVWKKCHAEVEELADTMERKRESLEDVVRAEMNARQRDKQQLNDELSEQRSKQDDEIKVMSDVAGPKVGLIAEQLTKLQESLDGSMPRVETCEQQQAHLFREVEATNEAMSKWKMYMESQLDSLMGKVEGIEESTQNSSWEIESERHGTAIKGMTDDLGEFRLKMHELGEEILCLNQMVEDIDKRRPTAPPEQHIGEVAAAPQDSSAALGAEALVLMDQQDELRRIKEELRSEIDRRLSGQGRHADEHEAMIEGLRSAVNALESQLLDDEDVVERLKNDVRDLRTEMQQQVRQAVSELRLELKMCADSLAIQPSDVNDELMVRRMIEKAGVHVRLVELERELQAQRGEVRSIGAEVQGVSAEASAHQWKSKKLESMLTETSKQLHLVEGELQRAVEDLHRYRRPVASSVRGPTTDEGAADGDRIADLDERMAVLTAKFFEVQSLKGTVSSMRSQVCQDAAGGGFRAR